MSNPTSKAKLDALEQAKTRRSEAYAHKDRRIMAMLADGVPKSDIQSALRVSYQYIQKVVARGAS